jgi:hypothetical protein
MMSRTEDRAKDAEKAKAVDESRQETVSEPGGFKNDPDEPTNPNEAIERTRRQVRPTR